MKYLLLSLISAAALITTPTKSLAQIGIQGGSLFYNQWRPYLKIPRYQLVSNGIYRGGRPERGDHVIIKKQNNIKTIINIENDMRQVAYDQAESKKVGIQFYSEPMTAFKEPDDEQVVRILKALSNPAYHPVFIHCKHGEDRTGMIIGLYRVFVEKWPAKQAYQEMLQNGFHPSYRALDNYFRKKTGMR